ncbi:beta-1,3-galactosyltransferase 2-like [Sander lucioperca]|uniref:Hexosyltransferase n=1 Tax=Sander lucioperca TaxID=283035 RepID=A0A8D0CVV0_SANLU|nr:beta-1,3-galactosyltransferase 2-like [Sander lucioperca]
MLEDHFSKRGQSSAVNLLMTDVGKLPEKMRWSSSCRNGFVLILVLAAVFFFYNTNKEQMPSDLNPKKWLHRLISQRQNGTPYRAGVTTSLPASKPTMTAFPQTEIITSSVATYATRRTTIASLVTQQMDQPKTEPPTPVPYKSLGPYLVEYPYEYHFIINEPKKCEQEKPFVVLMVPVAPSNRAHRDVIRSTWGGESLVLDKVVKLFFLMGKKSGDGAAQLQEQLLQESAEHRDIIQSDFLDCYKNLTIKTMVMLEWLDVYCSAGTLYAMKIDSDMFLNVPNLVSMLLNAPKTNYMTGLVARGAAVLRDPNSKWFVPVELFPKPQYPRYALGLGYVLSLDLPKKLIAASRNVTALYIEDVYLGLCMEHLGIPPTDPPNWGYFQVIPVGYSRCAYSRLIATTTNQNTDRVSDWKDFKKPGKYC